MTPQELRNSILQLAIQGKLVEQRPEEGTAEELLNKIQIEKCKKDGSLIKAHTSIVSEDEKQYDLPESWIWCRLSDLIVIYTGKKDANFGTEQGQYNFYTCSAEPIRSATYSYDGEYLIMPGNGANIGLVTYYRGKFEAYQRTYLLENRYGIFLPYLKYHLESNWKQYNSNKMYGSAIPYIKLGNLTNYPVALPPLSEQKRIVAKIEALLPYVDRYEEAWKRLGELDKRFPGDLQKSVLQLAIQGKLVEQRPDEGTAEELYREIQREKQRLVKEGKIKKEKPLPEIKEDEIPFEIPDGWKWVRLGEIGSWGSGATPPRTNPEYYNGSIPWLKTGDLNDGHIFEVSESITELALEKTSVRLNPVGSILMAMYGATIGKLGILEKPMTTNQACCACIPFGRLYNEYLFYFLLARRKAFIKMGEGGAQPNISKEKIVRAVFPLPPLSEQKRIVAKIKELLPLCERLTMINAQS